MWSKLVIFWGAILVRGHFFYDFLPTNLKEEGVSQIDFSPLPELNHIFTPKYLDLVEKLSLFCEELRNPIETKNWPVVSQFVQLSVKQQQRLAGRWSPIQRAHKSWLHSLVFQRRQPLTKKCNGGHQNSKEIKLLFYFSYSNYLLWKCLFNRHCCPEFSSSNHYKPLEQLE